MRDISLHLSDIIENSCAAGATLVAVSVAYRSAEGLLEIIVADNGRGMDAETVSKAADPFYTSRTTRKVGLGLPLLKANAELTGGSFLLESRPGKGTEVKAVFDMRSIDAKPLGDISEAVLTAAAAYGDIRFTLDFKADGDEFKFDTDEAKKILGGGLELNNVKIYTFLKEYLHTNIDGVLKGKL